MRTVYLLLLRAPKRQWVPAALSPFTDRTLAVAAAEERRATGLETYIVTRLGAARRRAGARPPNVEPFRVRRSAYALGRCAAP